MKIGMNKYEEHQVYLRDNGTFIWITSVDPYSKIKPNESDRNCIFHIGKVKKKNDEFDDDLMVVSTAPNTYVSFDIAHSSKSTLQELRIHEAAFLGVMTKDTISLYSKKIAELRRY